MFVNTREQWTWLFLLYQGFYINSLEDDKEFSRNWQIEFETMKDRYW